MPQRRKRPNRPASRRRPGRMSQTTLVLGTISTVIAIATGMFGLRDAVVPREDATATDRDYARAIGDICDSINTADEAGAAEERRLAQRLARARTNVAQRDALLDAQRSILTSSQDGLAQLRSLRDAAPDPLVKTHQAAVAAWTRNVERVLDYVDRLSTVETRAQLISAVETLVAVRRAVSRDGVATRARLLRLGGADCEFNVPAAVRTLTLPDLPRQRARDRVPGDPSSPSPANPTPPRQTDPPKPSPTAPPSDDSESRGGTDRPVNPVRPTRPRPKPTPTVRPSDDSGSRGGTDRPVNPVRPTRPRPKPAPTVRPSDDSGSRRAPTGR